jgi:hypothetical protein
LTDTQGARADLGPQLGPRQPGEHTGPAGGGPPNRLPEPEDVQLTPAGHPGRPGQAGGVVEEPQGLGDGAAVGVGVDQQHLPADGGRLEGEVDGDGGAARAALGSPDRGEDPPCVAVRRGRGLVGLRRLVVRVGLGGQRGPGPVHQDVRRVLVGGNVQQPELAEPALAVLIAGRGHANHGESGRGQPGQGVMVQPAGAGGDDRHLGLAGGGHREQVTQVVAPVQHLGRHLPRLAGLHQSRLPGRRPHPRGHQPRLHVLTAPVIDPTCWAAG